jgi:hypothetical protein
MNELESLQAFEEDDRWLHENVDRLRAKFVNKFVAIKNKQVIDYSSEIEELVKKLEGKKENPSQLVIEFINTKDFKLFL